MVLVSTGEKEMTLITPYRNILFNRMLYRLKIKTKPWLINGRVYWISDTRLSKTPEIVYEELVRGLYDIPNLDLGDVVIDLGAHVGMFTIPLAATNRKTTFICVEPNPTNYKNLKKNIDRYKLHNVVIINAGVWDKPNVGLASEYPIDNTGGSHTHVDNNSTIRSYTWQQIVATALLYCKTSPKILKVVKCDIEGAEHLIFKSAKDFALIDALRIEIHGSDKNTWEMCNLVYQNCNDYIIQRLYGEKVENLEKEEYSIPARPLRNLHGQTISYLKPLGVDQL